jgi:hypothetical protein
MAMVLFGKMFEKREVQEKDKDKEHEHQQLRAEASCSSLWRSNHL